MDFFLTRIYELYVCYPINCVCVMDLCRNAQIFIVLSDETVNQCWPRFGDVCTTHFIRIDVKVFVHSIKSLISQTHYTKYVYMYVNI